MAEDLSAMHRRLLADRAIQFDLPAYVAPPHRPPPAWWTAFLRWLEGLALRGRPHAHAGLHLPRWVWWSGFGFLVALALLAVAAHLLRRRARVARVAPADLSDSDGRPVRARALALLADGDRLAAEGRFGEAVRLLLHRSLQDIEARRPGALPPDFTARDVAGWSALPAPARADLGPIVAAAERHVFAARPVAAEDYAACRRAYERFAFPEAWT